MTWEKKTPSPYLEECLAIRVSVYLLQEAHCSCDSECCTVVGGHRVQDQLPEVSTCRWECDCSNLLKNFARCHLMSSDVICFSMWVCELLKVGLLMPTVGYLQGLYWLPSWTECWVPTRRSHPNGMCRGCAWPGSLQRFLHMQIFPAILSCHICG